jgi:diguanylate cyclase (GGDEF)-like protein
VILLRKIKTKKTKKLKTKKLNHYRLSSKIVSTTIFMAAIFLAILIAIISFLLLNEWNFGIELTYAGAVFVLILFLIIMGIILSRRIRLTLSPIDDILKAIDEIKQGKFDVHVNVLDKNELKDVANAINTMSKDIGEQVNLVYRNFLYDAVSGLKNRRACHSEIEGMLSSYNDKTAFCLIDIINMKSINMLRGQAVGDELLMAFGNRLSAATGDKEKVYANGGSEFLFILPKIINLESVDKIIKQVIEKFRVPLTIHEVQIDVQINLGIAIFPFDGKKIDELIKKCDTALFKAKQAGAQKYVFYNDQITKEVKYTSQIREQMPDAIGRGQMYLNFQPLIDIKNEVYGFEALVRWKSPTLGEINPQIFVNLAEESHLIIPIGAWVLEQACRAQVQMAKIFERQFVMSINVSPVQLLQKDFIEVLKKIIDDTGMDPHYLVLEITESVLIDSTFALEETINYIHGIKARIALDDFGTGNASLAYLRKLPFDTLKIDKSFIDGILEQRKDYSIVGSVIDLVHNLNMKVVAEGVESRKQYEFLKQISCDIYQGFLFSKPIDFEETIEYVDQFYKVAKARRIDVFAKDFEE